jgi:hypothetical protein
MSRSIAVLKLSPRVKNVITFAQSVATAMEGNSSFPTPNPPLTTLNADIAALVTAEAAVLARTKGAAETRDAKLAIVRADLEHERDYVQGVADSNVSTAESIIESAGMSVKKVTLHPKEAFTVKPGSVSGSVTLIAKAAAHRASYDWQQSLDQKTWTDLPSTLQAKTEVTGLTPGSTYSFRFRAVTKTGEGDFSQIVSLLVP